MDIFKKLYFDELSFGGNAKRAEYMRQGRKKEMNKCAEACNRSLEKKMYTT
jgi:hypothetical protein